MTVHVLSQPAADYHADTDRISHSMLKDFGFGQERSPRLYYGRHIAKDTPGPSGTQIDMGTLAHTAILEPDDLWHAYKVIPTDVLAKNGAKSTNAYRDWYWEKKADNPDVILLKREEFDAVLAMRDAVWKNKTARRLLEGQTTFAPESVFTWEDDTDLPMRARLDLYSPHYGTVLDLKSTAQIARRDFRRTALRMNYDTQDAHYCEPIYRLTGEMPAFANIAFESQPPYRVRVYTLSVEDRQRARRMRRQTIDHLAACIETDEWHDPDESEIVELELNRYETEM